VIRDLRMSIDNPAELEACYAGALDGLDAIEATLGVGL
jgi:hypothetical protein